VTAARILVVDDEADISTILTVTLRRAGYEVASAADGIEAIEAIHRQAPDLILLDVMMPRSDGLETLKRIRQHPPTAQVPVIMLTARAGLADKMKGFERGADDYVAKPFAFAELLVRVKALLRRGPVSRSSVVRVADLELDRLAQQVRRAGKRIDLTAKEFSLLEYLMSNAGRVLSRTMIIEHVWDHSFDGITNIVDVYVRHLRSKVDDAFDPKLIRTVRGVGYSIGHGAQP